MDHPSAFVVTSAHKHTLLLYIQTLHLSTSDNFIHLLNTVPFLICSSWVIILFSIFKWRGSNHGTKWVLTWIKWQDLWEYPQITDHSPLNGNQTFNDVYCTLKMQCYSCTSQFCLYRLHKEKVINQMCLLLLAFQRWRRRRRGRGDLALWWMPSLLQVSKVQFIHGEWSSLYMGWEEIAFSFDLHPRVRKWMESATRVSALWGDEYGVN